MVNKKNRCGTALLQCGKNPGDDVQRDILCICGEVILVDDASGDSTAAAAHKLGIKVIIHEHEKKSATPETRKPVIKRHWNWARISSSCSIPTAIYTNIRQN